jgi:predicted Fe-Mo cluster-binding NifX family protein
MKVAVSATGKELDATIDPRFGRCANFIIVETDDMSFEAFDNESIALSGGAGIQAAQFVASKGAKTVLTGNVGPNAVQTLSAANIEIFVGQSGTVRELVEKYKMGRLSSERTPNVPDHYGMGSGARLGRGMGMGRGGAMGGGRGLKRGMLRSASSPSRQSSASAPSKAEELKILKDQANDLHKKIEEIEANLKRSD